MNPAVQTRFPRIVRREATEHAPSQAQYVRIAVFLAVITSIEVAIYYFNVPKAILIVGLISLAIVKFFTVAAFFMHLKFDGKLLTWTFVAGIFTAAFAFTIVILTLNGMG